MTQFLEYLNVSKKIYYMHIVNKIYNYYKKRRYFVVTDENDKQGKFTFVNGINYFDKPMCILHDAYQDGGFVLATNKNMFTFLDNRYIREVVFDKIYRKISHFSPSKKNPVYSLLLGDRICLHDIKTLNYLVDVGCDAILLQNYSKIIVRIVLSANSVELYKFFRKYNVSFFFIDPPYNKWHLKIKGGVLMPDKLPANFNEIYMNLKNYN